MFYVVSYDIPDDKRRNRVARILKDYGERVQYSVFEANLTVKQVRQLQGRLEKAIVADEDSVRIYGLCDVCRGKVIILGQGEVTADPELYIV